MANDNDKFLSITQDYGSLYSDVCSIIDTTRHQLATAFTNYQLLMYWHIGARINHLTSSMRHPREIDLFTNLNENAIFPQPLV